MIPCGSVFWMSATSSKQKRTKYRQIGAKCDHLTFFQRSGFWIHTKRRRDAATGATILYRQGCALSFHVWLVCRSLANTRATVGFVAFESMFTRSHKNNGKKKIRHTEIPRPDFISMPENLHVCHGSALKLIWFEVVLIKRL